MFVLTAPGALDPHTPRSQPAIEQARRENPIPEVQAADGRDRQRQVAVQCDTEELYGADIELFGGDIDADLLQVAALIGTRF